MDPTAADWLTRVAIILELTGFLLAPWEFLDKQAFEHLDDRAKHYLRSVAYRTRVILIMAILLVLILIGLAFVLRSRTQVREESLTFVIVYVVSSPLVGVGLATSLKEPLDKALFSSLTKLAESKKLRLRLLGIGATLLVIGAILQFAGTF
jgi:flagellar biosynthesis protein FliQ